MRIQLMNINSINSILSIFVNMKMSNMGNIQASQTHLVLRRSKPTAGVSSLITRTRGLTILKYFYQRSTCNDKCILIVFRQEFRVI